MAQAEGCDGMMMQIAGANPLPPKAPPIQLTYKPSNEAEVDTVTSVRENFGLLVSGGRLLYGGPSLVDHRGDPYPRFGP